MHFLQKLPNTQFVLRIPVEERACVLAALLPCVCAATAAVSSSSAATRTKIAHEISQTTQHILHRKKKHNKAKDKFITKWRGSDHDSYLSARECARWDFPVLQY
jgi:hypothetical protein